MLISIYQLIKGEYMQLEQMKKLEQKKVELIETLNREDILDFVFIASVDNHDTDTKELHGLTFNTSGAVILIGLMETYKSHLLSKE